MVLRRALVLALLLVPAAVVAQVFPIPPLVSHVIVDSCSGCGGSGTVGQATMAASAPVVIASDQSSVHVTCDSGCGSPPATADGTAFVSGTTNVSPVAAVVDDVATTTVPENAYGAPRMSTNRVLYVDLKQTQANATAIKVDGSAVTQPVSGTFFQATQPVSGTVTANAGSGPFPVGGQAAAGAALTGNPVETAGSDGTNARIFRTDSSGYQLQKITDGTNIATVTAGSALKVDASATTQPVSGTVTATGPLTDTQLRASAVPVSLSALPALVAGSAVIGHVIADASAAVIGHVVADSGSTTAVTQATASNLNAQVVGAAASGAAKAGNPVQIGGVFNTTQPTVTNGQAVEAQTTARGAQIVGTGADTFNVTVNAALPAGTAVIGHVINDASSAVIGHVIVDTTSTTAVTQATGTNLHAVIDSGSTTAVTGTVSTVTDPTTSANEALTSAAKATVTSSVNVKASAGNVYGFSVLNGAGVGCWMELINSAGAGTLGTAVIMNIALPASGVVNFQPGDFAIGNFSSGIAVGVASAIGGASACGTAATGITVFFK